MTDNFIEQSVYLLDLYIVQFVYYPKIIPHVPREAAEQARHVEYFPRPDVVTNRTIRRSITRALRSYAHRVLNRRNVTQKDVVSYDVWYIQGHDTRARMRANGSHGSSINPITHRDSGTLIKYKKKRL